MSIPKAPPASLRLRIDSGALADNWRALDKMSGAAETGAAVKADAYGLGIDRVVPVLAKAGARQFFVAHWSEVADVIAHVPAEWITVLHGPCNAQEAAFAQQTGVVPVINSLQQAHVWMDSGGGTCHLMVDTGMNRLGISHSELGAEIIERLHVDILMSHLVSADENSPLNDKQLQLFSGAMSAIPAKRNSIANSAGIGLGGAYQLDLTRPGISLYGGVPRKELSGAIRQVVHPEACIIQIREVNVGKTIGYNAVYSVKSPMRIATVSIGYADGLLRVWSDLGALRHLNGLLPILGRVSMDMISVDVSAFPSLKVGDFLEFPFGLPDASKACGLSQYELLTGLGSRYLLTK